MIEQTIAALLAPARDHLVSVIQQAGLRAYDVPCGDESITLTLLTLDTVQATGYTTGTYPRERSFPLCEVHLPDLASMAVQAAREMAPYIPPQTNMNAVFRELVRSRFELRQKMLASALFQALVCPKQEELGPIETWPNLAYADTWTLDVLVHRRSLPHASGSRAGVLEVEFAPSDASVLRARLTLKQAGTVLGQYPATASA